MSAEQKRKVRAWRMTCHSASTNSHKFYDIYYMPETSWAVYRWGRVDSKGQHVLKAVSSWEVGDQLRSKVDKGYTVQVHDLSWETSIDTGRGNELAVESLIAEAERRINLELRKEASTSFGDQRLHEFTEEANEIITLAKSKKADVGVLLDRWDTISGEWKAMATAYEHARLALLEAEQAVSRKVMGG